MSKKGDGFWLETTEWDCPNHTYELIGGKCVGYIRAGSDEYKRFKKPLSFSGSRRKFIRVQPDANGTGFASLGDSFHLYDED